MKLFALFSSSSEIEATPANMKPTCLEPAAGQGSGREHDATSPSTAPPVCRALGRHSPTLALLSTQSPSSTRKPLLPAFCIQTKDIHTGTLRSVGSRPCPGTCKYVCLQPGRERSLEENGSCLCMAESLCCSPEPITALVISYTQYKVKR